jgi:hypothetical protein
MVGTVMLNLWDIVFSAHLEFPDVSTRARITPGTLVFLQAAR